jgi:hypothetical protein
MKTKLLRSLTVLALAVALSAATLTIPIPTAQAAGWTMDPNGGAP